MTVTQFRTLGIRWPIVFDDGYTLSHPELLTRKVLPNVSQAAPKSVPKGFKGLPRVAQDVQHGSSERPRLPM